MCLVAAVILCMYFQHVSCNTIFNTTISMCHYMRELETAGFEARLVGLGGSDGKNV